jgi:hypothetical protein
MTAISPLAATYLWAAMAALLLVLAAWVVMLQLRVNRLVTHYNRLIDGVPEGTLEDALNRHLERLETSEERVAALDQFCQTVESDLRSTLQRVGVVRFNPFADTGGDQSFAIALLDANGSGVVISSLFSRTSTRVFAKPVVDGKSVHLLTDEEQQAIDEAVSTRPTPGHQPNNVSSVESRTAL